MLQYKYDLCQGEEPSEENPIQNSIVEDDRLTRLLDLKERLESNISERNAISSLERRHNKYQGRSNKERNQTNLLNFFLISALIGICVVYAVYAYFVGQLQ